MTLSQPVSIPHSLVPVAAFPMEFPTTLHTTLPPVFDLPAPTDTSTRPTSSGQSRDNLAGEPRNSPVTSASTQAADAAPSSVKPKRPHPLKPPTDGELLFALPPISLSLTSNQRQTVIQPTASSLPLVPDAEPTTTAAETTGVVGAAEQPGDAQVPGPSSDAGSITTSTTASKSWSTFSWRPSSSSKPPATVPEQPSSQVTEEAQQTLSSVVPVVEMTLQTEFNGVVQLGLIDVPWLPQLISSYLEESLKDHVDKRKPSCVVVFHPVFQSSYYPVAIKMTMITTILHVYVLLVVSLITRGVTNAGTNHV